MHYVALCLCNWKAQPRTTRPSATGEGQAHVLHASLEAHAKHVRALHALPDGHRGTYSASTSSDEQSFWPTTAYEQVIGRICEALRQREPLTADELYDVATAIGCSASDLLEGVR